MKGEACRRAVRWLAAAGLAWSAHAMAALPAGAAAEILTLQGSGEQRTGIEPQWRPARVAQWLRLMERATAARSAPDDPGRGGGARAGQAVTQRQAGQRPRSVASSASRYQRRTT